MPSLSPLSSLGSRPFEDCATLILSMGCLCNVGVPLASEGHQYGHGRFLKHLPLSCAMKPGSLHLSIGH